MVKTFDEELFPTDLISSSGKLQKQNALIRQIKEILATVPKEVSVYVDDIVLRKGSKVTARILDMFLIVAKQFLTAGFMDPEGVKEFQTLCPEEPSPEQVELWETAREEACRLSWRPYMFDHSLPHRLRLLKDMPCETTDGVRVTLRANIGSPAEVDVLQARGAQGVGLYRTEYLFLNRSDLPAEHVDILWTG